MFPMQTAPHGFDNFCTPSLQDVPHNAVMDGRAQPAGSCSSSITSQLCSRLWKRNVSPQTKHSAPDQLHTLPCRHTGSPCQPAAPAFPSCCPQPAISGGSAHPSAGRSLRAVPQVRLRPHCLPLSYRVTHHP